MFTSTNASCVEPPEHVHSKSSRKNVTKDTTALLSSSSNISNLSVNLDNMTVTNNNHHHNGREEAFQNSYIDTNSSLELTNTQLSSTIKMTAVDSTQLSTHYTNHNNEMNDKLTTATNTERHSQLRQAQPQHTMIAIPLKERVPIKSIRIERDYSLGDGITRFHTTYPTELQGKITNEEFNRTITEINKIMDHADRLSWKVVLENIVEILSIYIWPVFFSTHYQRTVRRLLEFIEKENTDTYYPQSLSISNPVKSAFLFIEINFHD